jgi:hypothetical protein
VAVAALSTSAATCTERWTSGGAHQSPNRASDTRVSGHAERLAALDMIQGFADRPRAITLGADKGYDAADFVEELRRRCHGNWRSGEHRA